MAENYKTKLQTRIRTEINLTLFEKMLVAMHGHSIFEAPS